MTVLFISFEIHIPYRQIKCINEMIIWFHISVFYQLLLIIRSDLHYHNPSNPI